MDKVTKKVASKPEGLEGLQKQIDAAHKKIDMIIAVAERHFGADLNRDGVIGEVK